MVIFAHLTVELDSFEETGVKNVRFGSFDKRCGLAIGTGVMLGSNFVEVTIAKDPAAMCAL